MGLKKSEEGGKKGIIKQAGSREAVGVWSLWNKKRGSTIKKLQGEVLRAIRGRRCARN